VARCDVSIFESKLKNGKRTKTREHGSWQAVGFDAGVKGFY
jgi:hypothetical protein